MSSADPATAVETAVHQARIDLAARVHDGPLQLLAAAIQELDEPGAEVPYAQRMIKHAMRELRSLLEAPSLTISAGDLRSALHRWAPIVLGAGVRLRVSVDDDLEETSFLAYECARELVTNVGRHAGASEVTVRVHATSAGELLVVEDDGVGISADWAPGYGLGAMYRRVHTVGGTVDHRPRDPVGTTATVRVPARP